jgi:5-methylcytosine-specific restriction enzyme A
MICLGYHILDEDTRGVQRKTIQFELVPISTVDASEDDVRPLLREDLASLRAKAEASSEVNPRQVERTSTIRLRSAAIRAYALKRADGVCEYCQAPAPFTTSGGLPYLEVHHIKQLADGGPDHPEFVIGVCPNCHRRAHYGEDREEVRDSMLELVGMIEKDLN